MYNCITEINKVTIYYLHCALADSLILVQITSHVHCLHSGDILGKHNNDLRPNTLWIFVFFLIYPIMTTIILLQRPEYTLLMQLGLPGGSKMLILRNHSRNKITRVILNLRECFPLVFNFQT